MEFPPSVDDGRPPFDHNLAKELIGKYVLIGLTTVDQRNELKCRTQMHGRVISADASCGFKLKLEGTRTGAEYTLPPDTRAFRAAKPGIYSLRDTGERVKDPDFVATWIITQPDA